jgi:lambda family phage portal protein
MASLPVLRNYSRQLERNHPTARAAVDGLVALVVGSGIALEPDSGDKKTDDKIRPEWLNWCRQVTVDGRDIFHLQQQGFRDVVVAGELLWRLVRLPERAEAGEIPLSVLPLECEWIDDVYSGYITYVAAPNGMVKVGAITLDKYGRAVEYRVRNPEYNSLYPAEDLPASALVHVFEKRRSMQARGEPWMSPVIERLQQDNDLVDTELQSAITASSIGLAVTSEVHDNDDTTEDGDTTDPAQSLRLGGVARLFPGDGLEAFSHNRPSQAIAPFRSGIRGDIAAALRCPQRFLDRDVSKANYSSMRADMLDTDRLLAPVREWYGHATIGRLYKEVLPYLCIRAGVPMPKNNGYRLIPDGQPYVDPEKDVAASIAAIVAGLSTWEIEIGKRGGDAQKLIAHLKGELKDPLLNSIFLAGGTTKAAGIMAQDAVGDPAKEDAVKDS